MKLNISSYAINTLIFFLIKWLIFKLNFNDFFQKKAFVYISLYIIKGK